MWIGFFYFLWIKTVFIPLGGWIRDHFEKKYKFNKFTQISKFFAFHKNRFIIHYDKFNDILCLKYEKVKT